MQHVVQPPLLLQKLVSHLLVYASKVGQFIHVVHECWSDREAKHCVIWTHLRFECTSEGSRSFFAWVRLQVVFIFWKQTGFFARVKLTLFSREGEPLFSVQWCWHTLFCLSDAAICFLFQKNYVVPSSDVKGCPFLRIFVRLVALWLDAIAMFGIIVRFKTTLALVVFSTFYTGLVPLSRVCIQFPSRNFGATCTVPLVVWASGKDLVTLSALKHFDSATQWNLCVD